VKDSSSGSAGNPGSPSNGEPVFIAIGRLRRPHGVRGEIVMEVLTEFPERVRVGKTVYIGDDRRPLRIRSRRNHQSNLLLAFQERDTPDSLEALRNQLVFVKAEDLPPLPEGDYYHHQLIGLRVLAEDGASLGVIKELLETGSNDVLVIRSPNGPEILLPATDETILEVNLAAGQMRVHVLPGILPDEMESGEE
jgi:16S rRNA processing protein RimM